MLVLWRLSVCNEPTNPIPHFAAMEAPSPARPFYLRQCIGILRACLSKHDGSRRARAGSSVSPAALTDYRICKCCKYVKLPESTAMLPNSVKRKGMRRRHAIRQNGVRRNVRVFIEMMPDETTLDEMSCARMWHITCV